MRTGPKIIAGVFLIFILAQPIFTLAQQADTFRTTPFDRFWTRQRIAPKIGVGVQDRAFFEVGIIWQNIYRHPLSLASKGPYLTVDVFIDDSNLLLGPKIGYEFTAGVFGTAMDLTYFIDHNYDSEGSNRRSFALTPKIGLTILGFTNIFYGYQIPLSDERITTITRHRFSLVFNINKDYFDINEARRR